METCLKGIAEHFPLTEKELQGYSSLGLAYIGDCIFELFVRTMVVTRGMIRRITIIKRRLVTLMQQHRQR